jgi:hypothetical protein
MIVPRALPQNGSFKVDVLYTNELILDV